MDNSNIPKNNLNQHLDNLFNPSITSGNSNPAAAPIAISTQPSLVASPTISTEPFNTNQNLFTSRSATATSLPSNSYSANGKVESQSKKKFSLSLSRKTASQYGIVVCNKAYIMHINYF
ncbi:hypothetical protein CONCODRAFT_136914 [Conidiobolus coronatus NRRL 28638]|uniref:Uncharacterized protein n=1 Tax=Conidiobolus coronatus (strain ATCC 28846 / CBS 209.66 / NRRL 28638) TaxID=796925 RepID=A0A137PHZ8_CONC2|nr:hypothetical protein CONCODRAFT_136914 [Conidiobolus coronatus NRRL 28638]|eukprot:KXN74628.1 hypothetical protein CONCODRAFT_136914 [Conidiobolus coronatus NRRL 28638]